MTRRRAQAVRTAAQVARAAPQLSARQLEYWVERGWVVPEAPHVQGHPRVFSDREAKVLRAMARLTAAGIAPKLAAVLARRAVQTAARSAANGAETVVLELGEGVTLVIDV